MKTRIIFTFLALLLIYLIDPEWLNNTFLTNTSLENKKPQQLLVTPTQNPEEKNTKGLTADKQSSPSARTKAIVEKVIDGDTFKLENGQKVRLIGIDTPETKHPFKELECFANESYNKTKELIEQKTVELEKDVSETDRYGRLLRYVYLENIFINKLLVEQGYAHALTYPPDIKYQQELKQAQNHARNANLGLWKQCLNSPLPHQDNSDSQTTTNQ